MRTAQILEELRQEQIKLRHSAKLVGACEKAGESQIRAFCKKCEEREMALSEALKAVARCG